MAKNVEQEVYRTWEVAKLTGLHKRTVLDAIKAGTLYCFRAKLTGYGRTTYFIPRYAVYAWLGHQGAVEVAKHFDPALRKQLLQSAEARREIARVAQFQPKPPWNWDGQTNPLKHWRNNLGISAAKLAREMGLNERSIYGFEWGGYQPALRSLERYSKLMNIPTGKIQDMLDQWHASQRLAKLRTPFEQEQVTGWQSAPDFLTKLADK